jgi:hypothetical protein
MFFLASLKNTKILPITLFKVIVAAFRKPLVSVKLDPKPGGDSEICSVNRPHDMYSIFWPPFPLSNER